MDQPDMATRLALLEHSTVSREYLAEREDKLIDRFEMMLTRHESRAEDTIRHGLKVFGHDIAEQLQTMKNKINAERDERLDKEIAPLKAKTEKANDSDFLKRWGLPIGISAIVGGPGTLSTVLGLIGKLGG